MSPSLPVFVAILPIDWLLRAEDVAVLEETAPDTLFAIRAPLGLSYAINLLPTLLSFPSGIVRGGR